MLCADQIRRGRQLIERVERQPAEGAADDCLKWHDYNKQLLHFLLTVDELSETFLRKTYRRMCFRDPVPGSSSLEDLRAELRDMISVADQLGFSDRPAEDPSPGAKVAPGHDGDVLVVYGRNSQIKEQVARFLMQVGLEPILLEEQAAHGRTLIEKLEYHAQVAFAVVLLTADDVAALASAPGQVQPRARQNVIFELGFSVAKLSRERVCVLYEEGVELPSDFCGVEYKPLDPAGMWKVKLARELHAAGLKFDPLKAF